MFAAVLKVQHPANTMATLQELSLVTAVVAQSGVGESIHKLSPTSMFKEKKFSK